MLKEKKNVKKDVNRTSRAIIDDIFKVIAVIFQRILWKVFQSNTPISLREYVKGFPKH